MGVYVFSYLWDGRNLKRIITWILKSWTAQKIQKINYWQSFRLNDKNIKKSEIKILFIYAENGDKLSQFVSNFPELEMIHL